MSGAVSGARHPRAHGRGLDSGAPGPAPCRPAARPRVPGGLRRLRPRGGARCAARAGVRSPARAGEPAGVPRRDAVRRAAPPRPAGVVRPVWRARPRRASTPSSTAGEQRLAGPLGAAAAARWREASIGGDTLVHVPVHPARRAARGYDQAELLARAAAAALGVPVRSRAPARARDGAPVRAGPGSSGRQRRGRVRGRSRASGRRGRPLAGARRRRRDDGRDAGRLRRGAPGRRGGRGLGPDDRAGGVKPGRRQALGGDRAPGRRAGASAGAGRGGRALARGLAARALAAAERRWRPGGSCLALAGLIAARVCQSHFHGYDAGKGTSRLDRASSQLPGRSRPSSVGRVVLGIGHAARPGGNPRPLRVGKPMARDHGARVGISPVPRMCMGVTRQRITAGTGPSRVRRWHTTARRPGGTALAIGPLARRSRAGRRPILDRSGSRRTPRPADRPARTHPGGQP